MFPLWDDTYVEAGRRFVVSYLHRRYRRKMGITESGRPRPPNSSKSGHFGACFGLLLFPSTSSSEASSQAPSSRSSPPGRSKKRPYQATRAAAPPPPSPRSGKYEQSIHESEPLCSQRPINLAGSSQSPSHGRAGTRSPTPAQSSTSGTRNDNRRPPANLLAVRTFLESCSPGLGDLAPLFIDYGCDSRKYFVEISTWSEKDIYAFLNRVASHRMANPNAFVTMRPMDIELIARRCLELGKEKKI